MPHGPRLLTATGTSGRTDFGIRNRKGYINGEKFNWTGSSLMPGYDWVAGELMIADPFNAPSNVLIATIDTDFVGFGYQHGMIDGKPSNGGHRAPTAGDGKVRSRRLVTLALAWASSISCIAGLWTRWDGFIRV